MNRYQREIRRLLTSPKTGPVLNLVIPFEELAVYRSRYCNGKSAGEGVAKRDLKRLQQYLKVYK